MKVLTPIPKPFQGEHVIATHPPLATFVADVWNRRLNLFTGRALSDRAFRVEQDERAGRLALAGRALSPGIVAGLEIEHGVVGDPASPSPALHISAGYGLAHSGEDVRVPNVWTIPVRSLPVYAPVTVLEPGAPATPGTGIARRLGGPLGELVDAGIVLPPAAVLVLQPVIAEVLADFDPASQCEDDPANYAFEDRRQVDGTRALLFAWPEEVGPLPPIDDRFRNSLAFAVFSAEARLGRPLPWEGVGVPIALIGFDPAWVPLFVDRAAVARDGGRPPARTPALPLAGDAFLWQARMKQFAEHLAELEPAQLAEPITDRFRFLPPAGLLPRGAFDPATAASTLLPSYFLTHAVPVPTEQLDAALEASAPLAPLDTFQREEVELLVPVPQPWYEPRLLHEELVDPAFQQAIAAAVTRRGEFLQRRGDVRAKAGALFRATQGEDLTFPTPDPDALEPDEQVGTDPAVTEDPFGTQLSSANVLQVTAVEDLRTAATPLISAADIAELDARGLSRFIAYLGERVKQADDAVDFGFLQVHADIFRIRQLMLGATAVSRLATSSVLGTIVRGETEQAAPLNVADFVRGLNLGSSVGTAAPAAAPPSAPAASGSTIAGGSASGLSFVGLAGGTAATTFLSKPSGAGLQFVSDELIIGGRAGELGLGGRAGEFGGAAGIGGAAGAGSRNLFDLIEIDQAVAKRPVKRGLLEALYQPPQSPVVGKAQVLRRASLDARLQDPAAVEAKVHAEATRHQVISRLAGLDIALEDIPIPGVPALLPPDPAGGQRVITNNDGWPQRTTATLGEILADPLGMNWLLQEPHSSDDDEGGFFAVSMYILEGVTAFLRGVEGRVQSYRDAIARAAEALATVQDHAQNVDSRLKVIADELAEARHDVAVARSLLAEEEVRIDAINERRRAILDKHVTFLAYRRPRSWAAPLSLPTRLLEPAVDERAVPACLRRGVIVPHDLRALVDLFRDAPVRWFRHVRPSLDRLDSLTAVVTTLSLASQRAAIAPESGRKVPPTEAPAGKLGLAIARAHQAHQTRLQQIRGVRAAIDLSAIQVEGWSRARDRAADVVTLGDLIDAGHGRTAVARAAAEELDRIAHVASCLYERFGEVLPVIRLDWAERLSQFDAAVDMRNLFTLPRWREVEALDQREMQALVSWLYDRIDLRESDAVALMSDLVRVCLLLASHAPVNRIIAGRVAKPTKVSVGGRVELTVDITRVRVGMPVLLFSGTSAVARAVVEDLAGGLAAARVVTAASATIELAQGAHAQFGTTEFTPAAARPAPVTQPSRRR